MVVILSAVDALLGSAQAALENGREVPGGERRAVEASLFALEKFESVASCFDDMAAMLDQMNPGGENYALRGDRRSLPIELTTGATPRWSLGRDAAARIAFGGERDAGEIVGPPVGPPRTMLGRVMNALWPRYVIDA